MIRFRVGNLGGQYDRDEWTVDPLLEVFVPEFEASLERRLALHRGHLISVDHVVRQMLEAMGFEIVAETEQVLREDRQY